MLQMLYGIVAFIQSSDVTLLQYRANLLKFINSCKTNDDTYETAKMLLTVNSYRQYRDIIIVLLLISKIRSWPYMHIPAQIVNYCRKHHDNSISWHG